MPLFDIDVFDNATSNSLGCFFIMDIRSSSRSDGDGDGVGFGGVVDYAMRSSIDILLISYFNNLVLCFLFATRSI